ncbi:lamin tail domain-containing protein 2 isoform X3 [Nycticebus coucang]|uniref:lamin tail domain-containing protein 2 isoform X3 n=1 Tax=Nycticebus coucang TaxID=9470 RepID=UPI00234E1A5E|nr:lamin tail domain-containing protein 2 isoform X3 [Nycticebus coucang]
MAPESGHKGQGAEEEALPSLADQHLVSGDLEPPAGTPADPTVHTCLQDTEPHPTRVVHPVNLQVVPESLDPCTLRLLWGQRELEIQALRWAIQNGQSAQHCRILQEVVGLPTERSFCSQEKFFQNQIQKLSLELKEQKEQAQREKKNLEEQLLQARHTMQQLEAELETFKKSCLLKLAQSSWVGRMLRSQTGSVEVVTAETLMDPSDLSDDQAPATGESFRLEDVDWNSIAHRYPNLFTKMESSSGHKQPLPSSSLDKWSLESPGKHVEGCHKNVEWSSLPWMGTSSSGGADSDSSSSLLGMPFRVQKVIGHPPRARSFSRDSSLGLEDFQKSHLDQPSKTVLVLQPHTDPNDQGLQPHTDTNDQGLQPHTDPNDPGLQQSPHYCSLKIVAVSRREKFVRILNQSLEGTVDLGGLVLKQLVCDFPVCMYRFPSGTLLAPQHHVTVWGEGSSSAKKQPRLSSGYEPVHFHSSKGCVTLLLDPTGKVLSEYRVPHYVTPISGIFADNTDLSIDCFPLSEAHPSVHTREKPRRPRSLRKARRGILPLLSTSKFFHPREALGRPEGAKPKTPELLPAIPEAGPGPEDCQVQKELKVQVSARECAGRRVSARRVPAPPGSSLTYPRPACSSFAAPLAPGLFGLLPLLSSQPHPTQLPPLNSQPLPAPTPPCPAWRALRAPRYPGVPEERGSGLPDGGAVSAAHRREQIRLPLSQLPAGHCGRVPTGVGARERTAEGVCGARQALPAA